MWRHPSAQLCLHELIEGQMAHLRACTMWPAVYKIPAAGMSKKTQQHTLFHAAVAKRSWAVRVTGSHMTLRAIDTKYSDSRKVFVLIWSHRSCVCDTNILYYILYIIYFLDSQPSSPNSQPSFLDSQPSSLISQPSSLDSQPSSLPTEFTRLPTEFSRLPTEFSRLPTEFSHL